MERRVLIAIFLSFVVLYVYQAVVVPPPPKSPVAGTTAPGSAPATAAPPASSSTAPTSAAPSEAPAAQTPTASATAVVGDTAEREIRVETEDVIALFTNRGARLRSLRLKRYLDRNKEPQEIVENRLAGQPLPFTLRTPDEQINATINSAFYAVTGGPGTTSKSAPTDLRFEYRDSAGIQVVKTFHLEPTLYVLTLSAAVSKQAPQGADAAPAASLPFAVVWGPVGTIGEVSSYVQQAQGLLFQDGEVERLATSDLVEQPAYEGDFKYAGVDDNYFMVAALMPGPSAVTYQPVSIPPPANAKGEPRALVSFSIAPRKTDAPLKFFAGPKDFDVLASIDTDATRAINFGIFTVIVVPLLRSLKWVNGYVGNWGWSIIILTVIINAIMFPLRHKSVVSMRRMQELQPEVKAIQDRYSKLKATDPAKQKMNQELMALYKERGVNPAGGCVPMLLTFPLIFAFYALLSTAIELRGAPFFGWIHDLTAHDPLYITPVLMGASQVWQQRITPMTGADPAQQKLMMFMPVVFTFMFLWAPAGLAVYWFVSNVWGIGQQYLTNYLIGPAKAHPGTSASSSERRMKRVGGGKTEAAAREP